MQHYLRLLGRFSPLYPLGLGVVLIAGAFGLASRGCKFSIKDDLHVGFCGGVPDLRIAFYNDADYGPYQGSIVGIAGLKYPIKHGFGSAWGIYYRHFEWPDYKLWTLAVSVWYLIPIGAMGSFIWFGSRWLFRRRHGEPKDGNRDSAIKARRNEGPADFAAQFSRRRASGRTYVLSREAGRALRDAGIRFRELSRVGLTPKVLHRKAQGRGAAAHPG